MLEGPLAGTHVTGVEARGKHLLIHADDGRSADLHLGMHGRARLLPAGTGPSAAALNRAVMRTSPATPCSSAGSGRPLARAAARSAPTCCTAASTRPSTCAARA